MEKRYRFLEISNWPLCTTKSVSCAGHRPSFSLFYWMTYGRGLITSSGHAHLYRQRYGVPSMGVPMDFAENLGQLSCAEYTGQGNDFELITRVKMETRHPLEGSIGNEFPSICNHCGVMAAWSRKTLKKSLFTFFRKTIPYRKNFKILFRKFSLRYRSTCVQISSILADGK